MSVVGKSTCSGFKTGLYISYHSGNALRDIKGWGYSLKDDRISSYFDAKYMTLLQIVLHNSDDQNIVNFFTLAKVNFCMTLVKCDFMQLSI